MQRAETKPQEKMIKSVRAKKPYSPLDENIVEIYRSHCESGWSPRSFLGKLQGGEESFLLLRNTNQEFKKIFDFYTKKAKRISLGKRASFIENSITR